MWKVTASLCIQEASQCQAFTSKTVQEKIRLITVYLKPSEEHRPEGWGVSEHGADENTGT